MTTSEALTILEKKNDMFAQEVAEAISTMACELGIKSGQLARIESLVKNRLACTTNAGDKDFCKEILKIL